MLQKAGLNFSAEVLKILHWIRNGVRLSSVLCSSGILPKLFGVVEASMKTTKTSLSAVTS